MSPALLRPVAALGGTGADKVALHVGERPLDLNAAALPGLGVGEAARTVRFWLMAGTFFLVAVAINGTVAHVVPLLTDHGVSPVAATATLAVFGLATLSGRLLAGWLVDRVYALMSPRCFFWRRLPAF